MDSLKWDIKGNYYLCKTSAIDFLAFDKSDTFKLILEYKILYIQFIKTVHNNKEIELSGSSLEHE